MRRLPLRPAPFFNQNMAINTAKTEATDGRAPRLTGVASGPGLGAGQDAERALVKTEAWRTPLKVGGGRKRLVLQGQENLEQAGRTGRGEGVADVRLDRSDRALAFLPAGLAPQRLEAFGFDGITHSRAGGMALDQIDIAAAPAGLLVGHPHGPKLTLGAGREQITVNIVGQPDPRDNRVNMISISQGIFEALEHEHARPFADHEPIGSLVQRSSLAARREARSCENPI